MATLGGEGHHGTSRDPVVAVPPARPQSARTSRSSGHRGRAWRPVGNPQQAFSQTKLADVADATSHMLEASKSREPSVRRHDREESCQALHGTKDSTEALTALMLAVLNVYESRTSTDLWSKLLEPVRALVPCEEVKVVVHTRRLPQSEVQSVSGPFDPTLRQRMRPVTYVEQWDHRRIEGAAAVSQRICRIPSTDAERYHWDQYEVARSQASGFRCLIAVPLFDGDGNVLAVLKLRNRVAQPGGQPFFEFQRSDFPTLSAFAAIFAAIVPHPYLGHLGGQTPGRPKARLELTDHGISAVVSWRLPKELRGGVIQELAYGEVRQEDEYSRHQPAPHWCLLPCGLLEPSSTADDEELLFEYTVPDLSAGTAYAFAVRVRNLHMTVDWSEASSKLVTYLAAPHSLANHSVQLVPVSDHAVRLEWEKLETCDPGLQLVEYRIVACAGAEGQEPPNLSRLPDEQVVGVFISDGSKPVETALVTHLQVNTVYSFAIEARYAYVGPRSFSRVLVSEPFTFPTVDLTLPPPQPVSAEVVPVDHEARGGQVMLQWPYPSDVSQHLALQYRVAWQARHHGGVDGPRLNVSTWTLLQPSTCLAAQLVSAQAAQEVRLLDRKAFDGELAVQFRVVTIPQWANASPPSVWFHPMPPACPELSHAHYACSDEDGVGLVIDWQSRHDPVLDLEAKHYGDLGPVGYSVQYDFSRGNGRLATRFQVRVRAAGEDSKPRGDWLELPQQLVLQAQGETVASTPGLLRHTWRSHGVSGLLLPAVEAACEVELRLGNALFWTPWCPCGVPHLKVKPPTHLAGALLRLEDVRSETVRLAWPSCTPQEPGLRTLEYRVLCVELPETSDARIDAGGRIITWRTIDSLVIEASDEASEKLSMQHYTVRSLLPTKRYTFAVECRYARLPLSLAAAATARMEVAEPLEMRGLKLGQLLNAPQAQLELSSGELSLGVSWQLKLSRGAAIPAMLCYQLACSKISDSSEKCVLPAGLAIEGRGSREEPRSTDGYFHVDSAGELVTMEVTLATRFIEAAVGVPAQAGVRLLARVGDAASGLWTEWSRPSSPTEILAPAPVPAPSRLPQTESLLQLATEDITSKGGKTESNAGVRLSWKGFRHPASAAAQGTLSTLPIVYEVVVWCMGSNKLASQDTREALLRRLNPPAGVFVTFRSETVKDSGAGEAAVNTYLVPSNCLQPMLYYFFQVVASYAMPDGSCMQASSSGPSAPGVQAVVSEEPFVPLFAEVAAPRIGALYGPYAEAPDPSVLLVLPTQVAAASNGDSLVVECREGRLQATHEVNTGVAPCGPWSAISAEFREVVEGQGEQQVFLRKLPSAPCQFRLRCGASTSHLSAWTDTCTWCPEVVPTTDVQEVLRSAVSSEPRLDGLCVALGLGADSALSVRLLWPRYPPSGRSLMPVERYQARYRLHGKSEWFNLPACDLPRPMNKVGLLGISDAVCECCISRDLQLGVQYEFSLRLCNAMGRWSPWTKAAGPLALSLPTLAPGHRQGENTLQITGTTASAVQLAWKPFCVLRDTEDGGPAAALRVDEVADVQGTLRADYEMLIMDEHGATAGVLQREGIAFFDDAARKARSAWLEAEVLLEPNRTYVFEVRARLRLGAWGPSLTSEAVPPRLNDISILSFSAELIVSETSTSSDSLAAGVHVESILSGFQGGPLQEKLEHLAMEQKAAELTTYQLRSAQVVEDARMTRGTNALAWCEWPAVDVGSAYFSAARNLSTTVWLPQAHSSLRPGQQYLFSMRCGDEYGRWTEWSAASDIVWLSAPRLTPTKVDKADPQCFLRATPLRGSIAKLEWAPFRPSGDQPAVPTGLSVALQRVAYSLNGFRRLPNSSEWQSMGAPLCELVTERRATISTKLLAQEVSDLDERYEHIFKLQARWVDVPSSLGNSDWMQEVCSAVFYRPLELQLQGAPQAQVVASDSEGIRVLLRWPACPHLRDSTGLPVSGSRYQARYQRVHAGSASSASSKREAWSQQPAVLEDAEDSAPHTGMCHISSLRPGLAYSFSVRVGSERAWSSWSQPTAPIHFALPPPKPQRGDSIQVVAGRLQWQGFSTTAELQHIEYKVSALEWPSDSPRIDAPCFGRDDRLCRFRSMGYTTALRDSSALDHRGLDKVTWEVEGLSRGMQYRFFVCARYAALPIGAMVSSLPDSHTATTAASSSLWPVDAAGVCFPTDSAAWEAALGSIGIWSEVVSVANFPESTVSNM